MTTEDPNYCTPEAACHLDARPEVVATVTHGRYVIRCSHCAKLWWKYETPRLQIALQTNPK